MVNPMYPIILEEIGQVLKVSRRDLESDIKDIAEYWETCLDKADVNDKDTAIFLLTTCVTCYLRGRSIHLGNSRTLKKNNGILISLVTLIPLYVWWQPANHYPKIHELIPIETYKVEAASGSGDILAQAEKILQEKWED
jgi:hypothetical protein